MTNEGILQALGAEVPLLSKDCWRQDGSGEHHETLTECGEEAFERLRAILQELKQRGVIEFNEDALDEVFFGIGG